MSGMTDGAWADGWCGAEDQTVGWSLTLSAIAVGGAGIVAAIVAALAGSRPVTLALSQCGESVGDGGRWWKMMGVGGGRSAGEVLAGA